MMGRLHDYEKKFCPPTVNSYIGNLTSSYTDQSNEASMTCASVIMFVLAGLFFNLNLFSGISDVSAILDPKIHLFLTSALSLFLPVMSYLFSEAKNGGSTPRTGVAADLSLGAGLILAWMLLVELLRKKVDEIRMRGSYSGSIQRAGRVVWLGNLVFFNLRTTGRKAVFSILWILCATRVVQRIAYTLIGKYSYAHGKNARVINSYMAHILRNDENPDQCLGVHDIEQAEQGGQEVLMKKCKYVVMGEEKLVQEPTADGYKLNMTTLGDDSSLVTVGKVWGIDENDRLFTSPDEVQRSKRLCLSFALFKLLRRRFEHLPAATEKEARGCREFILKGLYSNDESSAEALFKVLSDEVNFLSEYYHSVVPVVLASPFFFLVNYFVVLGVVVAFCIMTIILCGNGDAIYAFSSIRADNYTLHSGGIGKLAICLVIKAIRSPSAFFSILDLSITALLFVIYFYEEIWEFFVFLFSNWFMVSLVSNYVARPHWFQNPIIRVAFRRIIWIRSKMSHGNPSMRQLSLLNIRWPLRLPLHYSTLSLSATKELVPNNLKKSIMDYLVNHDSDAANYAPITNGKSALERNGLSDLLSWACHSDSVAEVILTWHITTSILEVMCDLKQSEQPDAIWSRISAIKLSKYCAYLVAFHPELLPDNPEKAEHAIENIKKELRGMLGRRDYYLSSHHTRVDRIMQFEESVGSTEAMREEIQDDEAAAAAYQSGVVRNGAKLGRLLLEQARTRNDPERVWKVLADVWTELIIFMAPSSDEERVKGHEEVLVQGGEFITVLWALTTHTGVSRPKTLEDLFGESMRVPRPVASIM